MQNNIIEGNIPLVLSRGIFFAYTCHTELCIRQIAVTDLNLKCTKSSCFFSYLLVKNTNGYEGGIRYAREYENRFPRDRRDTACRSRIAGADRTVFGS